MAACRARCRGGQHGGAAAAGS